MAPSPPPGTLQVTHFGELYGQPWNVIHHARCSPTTAPAQADLDGLTEAFRSAATPLFTTQASSNLVYEGALSRFWTDSGAEYQGSALNPVLGAYAEDSEALSVAVVISWRVHTVWKGGKPRSYLPGIPESRVTNGRSITSSVVTAIQGYATDYLAAVAGAVSGALTSESLACLRRFAAGGSETVPPTYLDPPQLVDIDTAICRSVVGSQRRRLHR